MSPPSKSPTIAKTIFHQKLQVVALYDGKCSLCIMWANALRKLDIWKMLDFQNVQDGRVLLRFPQIRKTDALSEIHVLGQDGKIYRGFDGFRYIARFIPLFWPILPLLYLPGAWRLGSRAYEWLAKRRFLFGGSAKT